MSLIEAAFWMVAFFVLIKFFAVFATATLIPAFLVLVIGFATIWRK